MRKYLIYVVTLLILLAGIATVWVVIDTLLLGGGGVRSPYEIPEGRYDCFIVLQNTIIRSTRFPQTRDGGPLPVPKPVYEETRELLGATFHIGVYGQEETFARFAVQDALRRIEKIEDRVSLKREDSEVSKINREAFDHPVPLSVELYYIIRRAQEISRHTGGSFDITAGPLRRLWEYYGSYDQSPPSEEINKFRVLVGWKHVELDDEARTIRFKRKGVTIDLHDIIHGFALDQAAHVLRTRGIRQGRVGVAGSNFDGYQLFEHPEGEAFMLGIPDARNKLKYNFDADRPAVVIKGYYKGYKWVGNTVNTGIVDPSSGRTAAALVASATVVGPDAMTCEALVTAFAIRGGGRVNAVLGKFNPKGEDRPGE